MSPLPPDVTAFPSPASSDLSQYPEVFAIRKTDLINLPFDGLSTRPIAQLADMLILFERAYAREYGATPQPVAACSVFLIELLMRLTRPPTGPATEFSTTKPTKEN